MSAAADTLRRTPIRSFGRKFSNTSTLTGGILEHVRVVRLRMIVHVLIGGHLVAADGDDDLLHERLDGALHDRALEIL